GTYEPAIPPIVRIDGFNEDLPGGGIRLDIPPIRSPVGRSRRSKPLSTDRQPPPLPVSKRPIGDVLGSPSYIVAEQLLSKQWSVRMEALASLKSALVNERVCGRSITEEIGASLSNLIEKETHRKCLSTALGVVYLAAKAGPHCKILLRSLGLVTARRLADGSPQVSAAAQSCHEVWVGAELVEWWETVCKNVLSSSGRTGASSELKARLLHLLQAKIDGAKAIPADILSTLLTSRCLTDRHPGLRSSSERLLRYLLPTVDKATINAELESLTASERQALRPVLSRATAADLKTQRQGQAAGPRSVARSSAAKVPVSQWKAPRAPVGPACLKGGVKAEDTDADDVLVKYIDTAPRVLSSSSIPRVTTTSIAESKDESPLIRLRPTRELIALRALRDEEACNRLGGCSVGSTQERRKEVKRQFETQVLERRVSKSLLRHMFDDVTAEERTAAVQSWIRFLEMNPRQCEPFIDLLVHWMIVTAETAAGSSQLRRIWDTLADRVADCDLPKTVAAQLLAWMLTRSRGIAKERERKISMKAGSSETVELISKLLGKPLCAQGVSDLIRLAAHHIDEESFSSSAGAGLCRVMIA
ncbi:hypothetical protein FOZ62_001031, partial [Perkinsus olseni]